MSSKEEKNIKKEQNKFIVDNEKIERSKLEKEEENDFYPSMNDPNFSLKISKKKEFYDTKLETKIYKSIEDFKKHANSVCFSDYEIAQHQKFVKNFISFQTPYNSLLLYHGLGSGKTCSAIGISEQMRKYMNQMNYTKRIIVVASPNVQKNFLLQLFDEKKLEERNGVFTLNNCTGDKILKEVNPTNNKGLKKVDLIKMVNNLINKKYVFMGYTQFSNYIDKKLQVPSGTKNKEKMKKRLIRETFNDRLVIIDEVHNIRLSNDNKLKKISTGLFDIANKTTNFKMLLLSATPLYNNYKEIVWLLNLMNINDGRGLIYSEEIFDDEGNFKIDSDGDEVGKKMLIHKSTGYISYVRGENPYSFPFRIFPMNFNLSKSTKSADFIYPIKSIAGGRSKDKIDHIDLYVTKVGYYQEKIYRKIISGLLKQEEGEEIFDLQDMGSIGYTKLTEPIEALNIVYPTISDEIENIGVKEFLSSKGLNNIFTYKESIRSSSGYITDFEYKKDILEKYGRIFSQEEIGKYSGKIKEICDSLKRSVGISLIYSQYVDAGVIPMALALEEMGYTRYGNSKNLYNDEFKKKHKIKSNGFSYMMITGKKSLSSNWLDEFKVITDDNNMDGSKIKVVIITRTGSEGLDFRNLRAIHIMDPWYNMNRIEQTIGRGIRFCSHKDLPFEKRNCSIHLYASLLDDKEKETADLYVYRLAEKKAIKIGNVTRVLKESSVDCILNISQTNYSFSDMERTQIEQNIFDNSTIKIEVGDKPYSSMCDYKESCNYKCVGLFDDGIKEFKNEINTDEIDYTTFNEEFLSANTPLIIQKIKRMFISKYVYLKDEIVSEIKATSNYSLEEIEYALNEIVEDGTEIFVDKYDRLGKLINVDQMYLYQPIEIKNNLITLHDRMVPVNYKHDKIKLQIEDESNKEKEKQKETLTKKKDKNIYEEIEKKYEETIDIENKESKYYFTINELMNTIGVSKEIINKLSLQHILDSLQFKDKKMLLDYIYNNTKDSDFYVQTMEYFEKNMVKGAILEGFILQNEGKYELLLKKNSDSKYFFIKAKQGEINNLLPVIKEKFLYSEKEVKENFGNTIGVFINFSNKSLSKNEILFKIKNMEQERTTGARCDQNTKSEKMKLLNVLLNEIDNTIPKYDGANFKKIPLETCILIEFIFRYLDIISKDGKKWFLGPERAVLNKLERRIKL